MKEAHYICSHCNGSGEGQHERSSCPQCKGTGEVEAPASYTLEVRPDGNLENPREWAQTKMVCFHGRYDLGDDHDYERDQFNSWGELKGQVLKDVPGISLILPVYLYDHSGLALRTTPFSCPWDSGQVGWIYTTYGNLKEENLEGELRAYTQYLNGDGYEWIITDQDDDVVDSCGGYYDEDRAESEGQAALRNLLT